MNRRVHKLAVALLALTLSLNTSSAYAAATRDGGWTSRSVYERVIGAVKKLVKPLLGAVSDFDNIDYPTPPKP
jgi:hypothetical protein